MLILTGNLVCWMNLFNRAIGLRTEQDRTEQIVFIFREWFCLQLYCYYNCFSVPQRFLTELPVCIPETSFQIKVVFSLTVFLRQLSTLPRDLAARDWTFVWYWSGDNPLWKPLDYKKQTSASDVCYQCLQLKVHVLIILVIIEIYSSILSKR